MSEKIAKQIVKNKFWVVEDSGNKVATIQARDDGGFVYVHDDEREYFSSIKIFIHIGLIILLVFFFLVFKEGRKLYNEIVTLNIYLFVIITKQDIIDVK